MRPIEVRVSGVEALLKNVHESEAIAPDGISRVLKRRSRPILLYLRLILTTSLSKDRLPGDWNIVHCPRS